jgi:hypothetical protein
MKTLRTWSHLDGASREWSFPVCLALKSFGRQRQGELPNTLLWWESTGGGRSVQSTQSHGGTEHCGSQWWESTPQVCTAPRATCKTSSMTMTEKTASAITMKGIIAAPTANPNYRWKVPATMMIPIRERSKCHMTQTIVFLFTGNDKCVYLPNGRRPQILEGKPVFPHDGGRFS